MGAVRRWGQAGRMSARAPSQWGAVRDALSAIFNLEALLRNAAVEHKTLVDVLPEIHSSAALLREAFEVRTTSDQAASEAGRHGRLRLGDLDALLGALAPPDAHRPPPPARPSPVAHELDAAAAALAPLHHAG